MLLATRCSALAVVGLLISAHGAHACGIIEGWPAYWVDNADVIVRVRASEQRDRPRLPGDDPYLRPGSSVSTVRFELLETLKGTPPPLLEFDGEFVSWAGVSPGTAPRMRVRSDGPYSNCHAHAYKQGVEYLLMLKGRDGAYAPYWASSAATNEVVSGASDPWVLWVRDYVALQASGIVGTIRAGCDENMDLQPTKVCRFTTNWMHFAVDGHGKITRNYREAEGRLPLPADTSLHSVAFAAIGDDLLLTYEASDAHSGTGELVRLDAKTLAVTWRLSIPAFNVSPATIDDGIIYLGAIGFVAAVDLATGKFLWKHERLYDAATFTFTAFQRPKVGPTHVTFVESSDLHRPLRRITVDKRTGRIVPGPPLR